MVKILVVMSLAAAACGSSSYLALNRPPHPMPPRPALAVDVYVAARPTRPYVEVALLEIARSTEYSWSTDSDQVARLRTDAGARGCDGIIVGVAYDHGPPSDQTPSTLRSNSATCIAYLGPAPTPASATSVTPEVPR